MSARSTMSCSSTRKRRQLRWSRTFRWTSSLKLLWLKGFCQRWSWNCQTSRWAEGEYLTSNSASALHFHSHLSFIDCLGNLMGVDKSGRLGVYVAISTFPWPHNPTRNCSGLSKRAGFAVVPSRCGTRFGRKTANEFSQIVTLRQ
jgi:hypothetical protein